MSANQTVLDLTVLVEQMGELRPGVAQLLFIENIHPGSALTLRKEILNFKIKNPEVEEIDFIIQSPGGMADDAYRIVRTLRLNFKTVNVIVPFWAKSAATLLSLGANKIIMDEYGEFGPLDAQVGKARDDSPEFERESALNDEHSLVRVQTLYKEMFESMYVRIYEHEKINIPKTELSKQLLKNLSEFYEPLVKQIDTLKLGDKRRKLDIGAQYARRILLQFSTIKDRISTVRNLVDYLVNSCPDHGYVIDYSIISRFLDNVYRGNHFGEEYQQALTQLSLYMLEQLPDSDKFAYIAFVNKNKQGRQIEGEQILKDVTEKEPNTSS